MHQLLSILDRFLVASHMNDSSTDHLIHLSSIHLSQNNRIFMAIREHAQLSQMIDVNPNSTTTKSYMSGMLHAHCRLVTQRSRPTFASCEGSRRAHAQKVWILYPPTDDKNIVYTHCIVPAPRTRAHEFDLSSDFIVAATASEMAK